MAEEHQSVLNQVLNESKKEEAPAEQPEADKQEDKAEVVDLEEKEPEEPKQEEKKPGQEKKAEQKKPEERKPEEPKRPEFQKPVKRKLDENTVLVGKKPTMSYVLAAVTQFSDGLKEIHIKARGRSISRAVDVAEVVRNRFVQGVNTQVNIGTQEIIDENKNKINVSTIDIVLKK